MQYEIKGAPFPAVICTLNDGEQMITEGGGMSWMSPNMVMETTTNGGLGKAIGRMFSGDKMFQNRYTCRGGNGLIAFTSCCPGEIRPLKFIPVRRLFAKKVHFWRQLRALICPFISKRASAAAFSAARVLLCKSSTARG